MAITTLNRRIYLIIHHEIFEDGEGGHVDDGMLFYVVSSMAKAFRYIKISGVTDYSWWEIRTQVLDDPEYRLPGHIGFYGRKGGKLKKPPFEKSVAIFKGVQGGGKAFDERAENMMKRKVFIVLHHEISDGTHRTPELVSYIVSSMAKAVKAIKASRVAPYSWWEIQKQTLDDPEHEWPAHVGYFGLRGGKLKEHPYKKCAAIFEMCKENKTHRFHV